MLPHFLCRPSRLAHVNVRPHESMSGAEGHDLQGVEQLTAGSLSPKWLRRLQSDGRRAVPESYGPGFLAAELMMMIAPTIAIPAPTRSVDLGRCPSATHNQTRDAAM